MYKLDKLSIFLILLFLLVFAIVLNHYWETMWNSLEGFESKRKLELLYDNVYFDPVDKKLYEKNGEAIESSKFVKQEEANESVDFYKNGDKMYVLYFPEEKSTFIHIFDMKEDKQIGSKFYQGKHKIETVYDDTNNLIAPKLGAFTKEPEIGLLFNSPYEDLEVVMYKLQVQTQTSVQEQTDKPIYYFGLKYLGIRYLIVFQESSHGKITILKQESSNRPDYGSDWSNEPNGSNGPNIGPHGTNEPSFQDKIEIKFGNNEIKIDPQYALQLGNAFLDGYSMDNPFMMGAPFMKSNDYNKDYIRKTEVVPGFGYDYYYHPDHEHGRSSNTSTGTGAAKETKTESGATKVGVETVGVARDAVQGATSVARDTVDLAKETVGGATSLAKETVGGATSLAKDTVGGATSLARDTVGGATNLARDTVSGTSNAIGSTLSGTGNFIQSSASGIGSFVKDAAGGTVGLVKDAAGGTVGLVKDTASGTIELGREIVGGIGKIGGASSTNVRYNNNNSGYNSQGYYNSYGGPGMRSTNNNNPVMDQYSYNGAVPPRPSCNFIPRTADFSAFRR